MQQQSAKALNQHNELQKLIADSKTFEERMDAKNGELRILKQQLSREQQKTTALTKELKAYKAAYLSEVPRDEVHSAGSTKGSKKSKAKAPPVPKPGFSLTEALGNIKGQKYPAHLVRWAMHVMAECGASQEQALELVHANVLLENNGKPPANLRFPDARRFVADRIISMAGNDMSATLRALLHSNSAEYIQCEVYARAIRWVVVVSPSNFFMHLGNRTDMGVVLDVLEEYLLQWKALAAADKGGSSGGSHVDLEFDSFVNKALGKLPQWKER